MSADWYNALSDAGPLERAATAAIGFETIMGEFFGPGIGNQPGHDALLREVRGIANAATRAIADRISGLEFEVKVKRRGVKGTLEDEILDDHPLKMLLDKPHPNLSKKQWLRLGSQHLLTVGECHWLKVGNRLGVPMELHPIPPDRVTPLTSKGVVDGYRVRDGSGAFETLPADVVVRCYFPDPEYIWQSEGYLGPAGTSADTLKFMQQQQRHHFQHDGTPKTVLETNENANAFSPAEKAAFNADWAANYHQRMGKNSGNPALLPMGFKLVQLAMQQGADVTPLLEYFRDDLLMQYGTPRSILGQVVSGDRSSAETNAFVFDLHTVTPVSGIISDGLTLQLAPDFDSSLFIDFEQFVAPDKVFELERENADIVHKRASPNMQLVARGEDEVPWGERPPTKLGEGSYYAPDEDTKPTKPTEMDDPGAFEDDVPEDAEDTDEAPRSSRARYFSKRATWERRVATEKTYVPVFSREMRAVLRIQAASVLSRLNDQANPRMRAPEDITPELLFSPAEWETIFKVRLEPIRQRAIEAAAIELLEGIGASADVFTFTEAVRKVLLSQGAELVKNANRTTQARIAKTMAEAINAGESIGQMAKRIQKVFAVRRKQAHTIARTEILKATQAGQLEGMAQSSVVSGKRWNTSLDASVRDTHDPVEGQEVLIFDSFTLGDGERADAPGIGAGGGALSAHNAINCRCFVTPVLED